MIAGTQFHFRFSLQPLCVCLGFVFRSSARCAAASSLSFAPELIKVSCESWGRGWAECFPGESTACGASASDTEPSPTATGVMLMVMMRMVMMMMMGSSTQTSGTTSRTCRQVTACWPSAKAMETRSSSERTRAKTGEESEGSRVSPHVSAQIDLCQMINPVFCKALKERDSFCSNGDMPLPCLPLRVCAM